jgi:hypothetical protein
MGTTMHINNVKRAATVLAVALAAIPPHEALLAEPPTAAELAHPDVQPDALLARIIPEIQKTFLDPGSTQQFQLCPPRRLKVENGQIVSWLVDFVANSKNASGGYAGRTMYVASFKRGKTEIIVGPVLAGRQQGFDSLIAHETERQMSGCPRIPDDKIKALLAG